MRRTVRAAMPFVDVEADTTTSTRRTATCSTALADVIEDFLAHGVVSAQTLHRRAAAG